MIRTYANNNMIVGGSLMPDLVLVEAIQFSGLSDVGGAAGFGPETRFTDTSSSLT